MAGKKFPYRSAYVACHGDGSGKCSFGCIACGNCLKACKLGAILLSEGHAAQIDNVKCRACGLCVKACPQGIIHLHEDANRIVVACSNKDIGPKARSVCSVSCIGCGMCERTCTASAIKVSDSLARINEDLCLSCGMCAVKCPHSAIRDLKGILTE